MIDHVSLAVRDLKSSGEFYAAVLMPLGYTRLVEREKTIGFGKKYPEFWINLRADMQVIEDNPGSHVCLRAPTQAAVSTFHDMAVMHGGRSDGAPGERPASMTTYFGAFIRDLDGNKIEAVFFPK